MSMYRVMGQDGQEYGPVSAEHLRQWMAEGRVNLQTLVFADDGTGWKAVGTLPEFADVGEMRFRSSTNVQPPAVPSCLPTSINIFSPMVGTFHRAASRNTPPYVEVGQPVDKNTVVCIIEAMKVMNEIPAEVKGVITGVLAEDGKPVEYGQALFRVQVEEQAGIPSPPRADSSLDEELLALLRVGKYIEAIKLRRERIAGEGLKEAKDAVEALARQHGLPPPKSGCFIATAACGTEQAPEVDRLRQFRDAVLRQSACGSTFIRVYETVSPPLARAVAHSKMARWLVLQTIVRPGCRIADWALSTRSPSPNTAAPRTRRIDHGCL